MRKRMICLVLCAVLLFTSLPTGSLVSLGTELTDTEFVNYGAAIGSTTALNLDYIVNFLVFSDPATFDYEADWDNDENWLYYDESEGIYDVNADQLFVIRNYYYDSETTALWYQVAALPGETLPEKMRDKTWVFQNFTEEYEYEGWEEYAPDTLLISDPQGFVFDKDGNAVSSVTMSVYDEVELTGATSLIGKIDYQWQIFVGDQWVDIHGEDEAAMGLNVGILANALSSDGIARVRCVTKSGSKSVTSDPVSVTVVPYVPAATYEATLSGADGTDSEGDGYVYVTVKYLFENGSEAASPFVAKVLQGEMLNNVKVEFPAVTGYLPYFNDQQTDSMTITQSIDSDLTFTVIYLPTEVDYKVDVYIQNIDNDDYTFESTETLQGLTGSQVPENTVNRPGMYELLHERPTIAANGSTRVEVRFNRFYYLTTFELDGGFGVYPIYARYGAPYSGIVGTPTKPGYTFVGWDDVTSGTGDGIADVLPAAVPAENRAYNAIWKENPTAEVRIAFWGENPNDEGYSYIESQVLNVKPGTELTYGDGGYICGLEEHTHGSGCTYNCGYVEHIHSAACYTLTCEKEHAHTDTCYTCGETGHTHTKDCYSNVGNVGNPDDPPDNPSNGRIYSEGFLFWTSKYIYINGVWYEYNGNLGANSTASATCGKSESSHTHTDTCLGCGKNEHSHTDYTGSCYTLTCTQQAHIHDHTCTSCLAHQHSEACRINPFKDYSAAKWVLVKSDTVTVAADGTTVMNVYFDRTTFTMTFKKTGNNGATLATITDKWGADIRERFQDICKANTFLWSRTTNGDSPWTSFLDVMPEENRTYYAKITTSNNVQTAIYWGEDTDGEYTIELFKSEVKYGSNLKVSKEEFVEIEGYTFNAEESTKEGADFNKAEFYYDRASFRLEFHSGSLLAREEAVLYKEPLDEYADYIPPLPDEYEPGSRRFVGWYLNPECTGDAVDLTQMEMGAKNLALYAKWELVTHQVRIFKEKHSDGTFGDPVFADGTHPDPVTHGKKVFSNDQSVPIPENSPYKFEGWFYMDGDQEKGWDFENSVVTRDVDIYAKWSANVLVPYTVRYVVQNTDGTVTEIADPLSSSALAGTTVTFHAKTGNELYDNYRAGYFPLTTSHSLTMDINQAETGMTYDFVYVAKDKVPYTVRYVDENGNDLIDPKEVNDNTYAIVTEKFVYIQDYVPDQYQKTLVLSGAEGANNEIVFHYKKDSTQSVYNVTHYIRSTDGTTWLEHSSYGDLDTIGDTVTVELLELNGFTFLEASVNGENAEPVDGKISELLPKEGLDFKLYYERNKYPYKIQYLDEETGAVLRTPDINTEGAYYGSMVTETNPPVIDNYQLSSVTSCRITIEEAADPVQNVVTVYYKENTVKIHYEVVGPNGCGTVNPKFTEVKVHSSTGAASTATPNENFRFEGWYSDPDCTQKVTSNPDLHLTKQPDEIWTETTYYAKFVPDVNDLTIRRENGEGGQVYVYRVENLETGEVIYVTIAGTGSVTIHDLPVGNYTVTQQNSWSWRHSDPAQSVTHTGGESPTEVTFDDSTNTDYWLNGNSQREQNQRRP